MRAICQLLLLLVSVPCQSQPLRISVYATAGNVERYLSSPEGRQSAEAAMRRLGVTRIFLEGRRGDEYVAPQKLSEIRDYFAGRGFLVAGGIATVPGKSFGVRQNEKLGWFNWESAKTQEDIAQFFAENAPLFQELVIDDFYCTADTSPGSEKARGNRSWGQYRRDLLTGLIEPMIRRPASKANPGLRLTLKYPQWYDRLHLFGYDPLRMSPAFERIWVGTEVRNPLTQRMGYVQPTQGYMNFRWLGSVAGSKVEGAWFDHIECTAQNFVDQAYQSVLAGAREITLFHLGDIVEGHPGHKPFVTALPELIDLAAKVAIRSPKGIAYYKPPGSDAEENFFLMDYFGMLGLPIVPEARYPLTSCAAILGVQAATDPNLLTRLRQHLKRGATIVLTPALIRKLGPEAEKLAGVKVSARPQPGVASGIDIDLGITVTSAKILAGTDIPLLTAKERVLVCNVRTFSEQDYRDTGEWLLPPKPRGIVDISRDLADQIRGHLMAPLGIRVSAPVRVAFYDFGEARCFYNFRSESAEIRIDGKPYELGANRLLWFDGKSSLCVAKSRSGSEIK